MEILIIADTIVIRPGPLGAFSDRETKWLRERCWEKRGKNYTQRYGRMAINEARELQTGEAFTLANKP